MIYKVPAFDPDAPIVVIGVGNTHTTLATWRRSQLVTPLSAPTGDAIAFKEAYVAHLDAASNGRIGATVIGSVVPGTLASIAEFVRERTDKDALIVGETISLPMEVAVIDPKAVGVDRVCGAAAAYDTLKTGCTIVSFGTAVTIDLVDDEGTFVGGAILPGVRMQIQALHEHTAQLPEVEPGVPALPYGRDTKEAIQTGVCRGLAGAVRGIVEGYASHLTRWPQVVATGGDLTLMSTHCDFLDSMVTHLVLRGIALAYTRHAESMGA